MRRLPILHLLAAAFTAESIRNQDQHRDLSKKEERESDPPTAFPAVSPTAIPTVSPMMEGRHSPMMSQENSKPSIEICHTKDAEQLDICAELFYPSLTPSIAPSTKTSTEMILSSTSSTETQTIIEVHTTNPTSEPTKIARLDAIDLSEINNSSENGLRGRVLIELSYFEMFITIYFKSQRLRKSSAALDPDRERMALTTQYEHAAVRQHLYEVYRKSFTNPMISLNLTFIDTGEKKMSKMITKSRNFFGSIVFEKAEGTPDPTITDLDTATSRAFLDDEKRMFLDKLEKNDTAVYGHEVSFDVIVQKMVQTNEFNSTTKASEPDALKDNENAKDVLRIVGMIAVAFTVCAVIVIITIRKKRMRQFLQEKNTYGGFESHGNIVHGFGGSNVNDAYMDSASITSRSVGESVLQLNFLEEPYESSRDRVNVEIFIREDFEQAAMPACLEGDRTDNSEVR